MCFWSHPESGHSSRHFPFLPHQRPWRSLPKGCSDWRQTTVFATSSSQCIHKVLWQLLRPRCAVPAGHLTPTLAGCTHLHLPQDSTALPTLPRALGSLLAVLFCLFPGLSYMATGKAAEWNLSMTLSPLLHPHPHTVPLKTHSFQRRAFPGSSPEPPPPSTGHTWILGWVAGRLKLGFLLHKEMGYPGVSSSAGYNTSSYAGRHINASGTKKYSIEPQNGFNRMGKPFRARNQMNFYLKPDYTTYQLCDHGQIIKTFWAVIPQSIKWEDSYLTGQ